MSNVSLFTLPNGIRVIHKYVNTPVCYSSLIIGSGTVDELDNEHGVAHFLEHILFKGTKKRKAYHINNRLESVGGELNAYITKEDTTIHATTLKEDFPKAIELIADIVFNSTFPEKEIEKEKEVVCEEIDSYKDSPSELIFDEFENLLYPNTNLGRSILGEKKSVKKISSKYLNNFISRTYNTDKMVFSCFGKIPLNRLKLYCDKYLSSQKENCRTYPQIIIPEDNPFLERIKKNTFQLHVLVGSRAYSLVDKNSVPLSVLSNYIGGPSANSLLNVELREKNGLAYNVETNYTAYTQTGNINIYLGVSKKNEERSLEIVERELKKLRDIPLSSYQVAKIKKQYIGQLVIAFNNSETLISSQAKSVLVQDKIQDIKDTIKIIESINSDKIQEIAQEIFSPNKLSSLIYY